MAPSARDRRPLVGIARERETSVEDAAPCQGECRTAFPVRDGATAHRSRHLGAAPFYAGGVNGPTRSCGFLPVVSPGGGRHRGPQDRGNRVPPIAPAPSSTPQDRCLPPPHKRLPIGLGRNQRDGTRGRLLPPAQLAPRLPGEILEPGHTRGQLVSSPPGFDPPARSAPVPRTCPGTPRQRRGATGSEPRSAPRQIPSGRPAW